MSAFLRRLGVTITSIVGTIVLFDYFVLRTFFSHPGAEDSTHSYLAGLRGLDGGRKGWGKVHVWSGSNTLREPENAGIFRSQCGQDKMLVEEIYRSNPRNRFFIDLASNDPVYLSNSFALETHFNWKGICIEANPVHYIGLSKRKCTAVSAVVNDKVDEEVIFNFQPDLKPEELNPSFPAHLFGGIASKITDNINVASANVTFRTTTLEAILNRFKAPKVIDYLSLDVEGAETQVMSVFPFHKYQIMVITVERPKIELHNHLVKNGYWFVKIMSFWGEALYVHRNLPNLAAVMATRSDEISSKRDDGNHRPMEEWWDYRNRYIYDPKWAPTTGR